MNNENRTLYSQKLHVHLLCELSNYDGILHGEAQMWGRSWKLDVGKKIKGNQYKSRGSGALAPHMGNLVVIEQSKKDVLKIRTGCNDFRGLVWQNLG